MVRDLADLHVHSSVSDGRDSPSDIVRIAASKDLGGIALTDHDTIDGLAEFMDCESPDSLVRVPGVEISTELQGAEAHILGYFVPYGPSSLRTRLRELEKSRKERMPRMVRKLQTLGIEIDQARLDEDLEGVGAPGRPHLARALVEEGVVDDTKEAFDKYLARGKPAYVRKERMDTIEAIRLLRHYDAVPVLAHPFIVNTESLEEFIQVLVDEGLGGLEVAYDYGHLRVNNDIQRLERIARSSGLVMTGGSDHHGDSSHASIGDVTVPVSVIRDLQDNSAMWGGNDS